MSLPYPDPSNPALPSPLFSDMTATRGDHLRANNAAIFADLDALDERNPALVALTTGSFKTAALANANTYNGRSSFSVTAGVTDTPYAGVWRIEGVWNPADSSGRFVATLDTTLETWEINYSGAAWGAWTKRADASAIHVDVAAEIDGIDEKTAPVAADVFVIEDSADAYAKKKVQAGAMLLTDRKIATLFQPFACWCDYIYKDTDEIIIRRKAMNGQTPFIGVWVANPALNTAEYIEKTDADITVKYDTPANGGNIGDGITAKLNNAWFIPWFYKKADGTIGVKLTWMPDTTFSNNNPTTTLTLNTVNGQNVGYLFNTADLLIWNAATKFETFLYNTTGGYTPDGACRVVSRSATVLTLDGSLGVANFSAGDYVVQLDNFKPLAVDDGEIIDDITAGGGLYRDCGLRFMTDGSGNIREFTVMDGEFYFINGTGAADYARDSGLNKNTVTTAYTVYREPYCPPDKCAILRMNAGNQEGIFIPYFASYGYRFTAGDTTATGKKDTYSRHGLYKCRCSNTATVDVSVLGYML